MYRQILSFEYFKFVSSLFWHSIIIINILFYIPMLLFFSGLIFLVSVHLNVIQYVCIFMSCSSISLWCIVVFTEVKKKKKKMFVKRGGCTGRGAQNDTKGVERKIKRMLNLSCLMLFIPLSYAHTNLNAP